MKRNQAVLLCSQNLLEMLGYTFPDNVQKECRSWCQSYYDIISYELQTGDFPHIALKWSGQP